MTMLAGRRYALDRAIAMVRERPLAFLLAVVLTASALALPLALASVLWSMRPVLAQVQPDPEISVFISARATDRDVEALKGRLAAVPGVAAVTLRPKDAAFAQLLRKSGFASSGGELGPNPLPDVLIARLALPMSAGEVDRVSAAVKGWPLVDTVRSDLDWYRKVHAIGRLSLTAIAVFGSIVVLLVALILVGTVRLHAAARTDELELLRLVGATRAFIARPYSWSAALTMAVASMLAIAVVLATHAALRAPVEQLTALYGSPFRLPDPELPHLVLVFLASVAIGWLVGLIGARVTVGQTRARS
jgi:cell division transport system permease protein